MSQLIVGVEPAYAVARLLPSGEDQREVSA